MTLVDSAASLATPSDQQLEDALSKLAVEDPELYAQLFAQMMQQMSSGGSGSDGTGSSDAAVALNPALTQKPAGTEISPLPGFVLKTLGRRGSVESNNYGFSEQAPDMLRNQQIATTKVDEEVKVFINICHSPYIPSPPLATDEEIQQALLNQDNSKYRVPLSLSAARSDMDKSGRPCVVFDACVNTDPLERAERDADFKIFLIELALQWIEERHNYQLSREFSLLRMKSKGSLVKHFIKRQPKPFIADANSAAAVLDHKISSSSAPSSSSDPSSSSTTAIASTVSAVREKKILISEPSADAIDDQQLRNVSSRRLKQPNDQPAEVLSEIKQPDYQLMVEEGEESGEEGGKNVEFLILNIKLPDLNSTKSENCTLDVEMNRLLFKAPGKYFLDLNLPHPIVVDETGAQFDRGTRELTITMTVAN